MPARRRSTSFMNCCPCSQKCAGMLGERLAKMSDGGSVEVTFAVKRHSRSSRRGF
jgi:hypothetical protein